MSEGRLEERLGLRSRVTHCDMLLMEEPCFLVLTILTPKLVFSLHYPAVYSKFSPIMICLSFISVLLRKEIILFIPRERITITTI